MTCHKERALPECVNDTLRGKRIKRNSSFLKAIYYQQSSWIAEIWGILQSMVLWAIKSDLTHLCV